MRPPRQSASLMEKAGAAGVAILALAVLLPPEVVAAWVLLLGAPTLLLFNAAVQRPKGEGLRPLLGPAVLFALALIAAALAASPFAPGGVNPFWGPVGAGAAAVDREGQAMGALKLLALAAAFEAARRAGGRRETARIALLAFAVAGCVLALAAFIALAAGAIFGASPILPSAELRGGVFAALIIITAEPLARRLFAGGRGEPLLADRRSAVGLIGLILSAAALLASGTGLAMVVALVMLTALAAWTALAGGGQAGAPRRIMLWLIPAIILLAMVVGLMVAARLGETAAVIDMGARSWTAFWASPWLGYGLGSSDAVARLFMTRADFTGVAARAPAAILTWLEEGGVLTVIPLILCLGWITVSLVRGAVRAGRSGGAMRIAVLVSVLMAVLALFSPASGEAGGALLWVLILGLGVGGMDSR